MIVIDIMRSNTIHSIIHLYLFTLTQSSLISSFYVEGVSGGSAITGEVTDTPTEHTYAATQTTPTQYSIIGIRCIHLHSLNTLY